MWTKENHRRYNRSGLRYDPDLSDHEWAETAPLSPPAKPGGNRRSVNLRQVVSRLMYILASAATGALSSRTWRPAARCMTTLTALHPQGEAAHVAEAAPECPLPLHPDTRLVVEPDRDPVLDTGWQVAQGRPVRQRPRTCGPCRQIHLRLQRRRSPLHLDQESRPSETPQAVFRRSVILGASDVSGQTLRVRLAPGRVRWPYLCIASGSLFRRLK